jgi:hypothetical protein
MQRIGKYGGKFVCMDGLESRNPQEEKKIVPFLPTLI